MPDRFTVTLFPNGANPDRGKYQEDERRQRIALLLDAQQAGSDELASYLGPTDWRDWQIDHAIGDCRENLGLQEGLPAPAAK